AFEKKPVQHGSRINDNRLVERQMRTITLAGNKFDGADQFFWVRPVQKEGIRLNCLVGQAAAAWLFPGQMFIENSDAIAGPSQPLPTHGAGRSSTHDRYFPHANPL